MKKYLLLLFLVEISKFTFSQNNAERLLVDTTLAPFYHGVASGDPDNNSVLLWTRITTNEISVNVSWKIATDTAMQNIITSGNTTTDGTKDYTVKILANNLQPNTYYFYEFEALGKRSIRGRTKTLPTGTNVNNLRVAVVSCANMTSGYFNVYNLITARNDIDAVIHLGDYIYEYGTSEYGSLRVPEPTNEILTLADYRIRHSSYKLDPMLMRLHQQYPFFTTWDDHEFTNNAYKDGAENHDVGEGNWNDRKNYALQAYKEWMPIRTVDASDNFRIFRKFNIGNLADLYILDTRIYDRDEQSTVAALSGVDDSSHHLLGNTQFNWLKNELQNSTAKWKIVAQQVMVAPFKLFNLALNSDQWDGYPSERKKFFDMINNLNVKNLVVLTGDIHSSWAQDLPFGTVPYNPATGAGSAGVEFVTSAVSSPAIALPGIFGNLAEDVVSQIIRDNNTHLLYNDMVHRGYTILDINNTKTQSDYFDVERVDKITLNELFKGGFYTNDLANHLQRSETPTSYYNTILPIRAPANVRTNFVSTAIKNTSNNFEITGAYPNPFYNWFGFQYYLQESTELNLKIFDITGKLILEKNIAKQNKGLHFEKIDGTNLPVGEYIISLSDENATISRKIQKID